MRCLLYCVKLRAKAAPRFSSMDCKARAPATIASVSTRPMLRHNAKADLTRKPIGLWEFNLWEGGEKGFSPHPRPLSPTAGEGRDMTTTTRRLQPTSGSRALLHPSPAVGERGRGMRANRRALRAKRRILTAPPSPTQRFRRRARLQLLQHPLKAPRD